MLQTAQKFYRTLLKLRDLGHPQYVETMETVICSDKLHSVESAESKVVHYIIMDYCSYNISLIVGC